MPLHPNSGATADSDPQYTFSSHEENLLERDGFVLIQSPTERLSQENNRLLRLLNSNQDAVARAVAQNRWFNELSDLLVDDLRCPVLQKSTAKRFILAACGHEFSAIALNELFQSEIHRMALSFGLHPQLPAYDRPSLVRIKEQGGGLAKPRYRCPLCQKHILAPPVECRPYSGLAATLGEIDGLMAVTQDQQEHHFNWSDYFLFFSD